MHCTPFRKSNSLNIVVLISFYARYAIKGYNIVYHKDWRRIYMLGKNSGQLHLHDVMVYEQMIPKNHILIKIDQVFDFSFVYDLVSENYSNIGRESKDPEMMIKILLMEYLFKLSDIEIKKRIQTDVAFRWFLKLSMTDNVPDDTTISHFRIHRMNSSQLEVVFNQIIERCMEMDLVKANRYLVDSTNINANVNYPSLKKLARQSSELVLREIRKINAPLAEIANKKLEAELTQYHDSHEKFSIGEYNEIVKRHLNELYMCIHEEFADNEKLTKAFALCKKLVEGEGGRIISVVDTEARVAYKSPGHAKTGYKNSIITDEDSEIILAYEVTPFNVNDDRLLPKLVTKVEEEFALKPKEVSADKGYATTEIRAYLYDKDITSNIDFYTIPEKEKETYTCSDCQFQDNGNTLICPNGVVVDGFKLNSNALNRVYKVSSEYCRQCPKRNECLGKKEKVYLGTSKSFVAKARFDAILKDQERVKTEAFQEAKKRRFKIERRFAAGVTNHMMRRTRFIGLEATTKHVALSNIAVNLIRVINLLERSKDTYALSS